MRNDILRLLCEQLPRESKLAVLAGHYALFQNDTKDELVPGIPKELPESRLRSWLMSSHYTGVFPMRTFLFGLKLARTQGNGQILNLVNDWRWVPTSQIGQEQRLRYFQQKGIPDAYLWSLSRRFDVASGMVPVPAHLRVEGNQFNWSEVRLRENYLSKEFAGCNLKGGCAQEFVPLLVELDNIGYADFVALIPGSCKEATITGTREVKAKLGPKMNVYTLYFYNTLKDDTLWDGVEVYKNGEFIN